MSPQIRKYDHREFLVLPENRLAVAAVQKLAPQVKRRRVRLVTIVGPAGSGKSHLARQLLRSWEDERLEGKRYLLTASQFAAQLAEASASGTIAQFQTRYRNDVQLFICEDLQALGPRKESQQQLVAAIDFIISHQGVVLLTACQMPGSVKGLSRRLVNRIHGGICVNIDLPEGASRRKLIEQFRSTESLPLTEAEIETIVSEAPRTPRELLGLLAQLQSEIQLRGNKTRGRVLNLDSALADRKRTRNLTLTDIARVVSQHFEVKPTDLKGPGRSQTIALARQTAMFLARELLQLHYAAIGEFFHRGNHSTVIHACQKIAELQQTDPTLTRQIEEIREELEQ